MSPILKATWAQLRSTQAGGELPTLTADIAEPNQLAKREIAVLRRYSAATVPLISIIIPVFNTERWVEDAIRSALQQTVTQIEVVVVDDGSSDESLTRTLAFSDERLTILSQPNQGLSAARNAGILVASAELIGFLDGDDVWFPKKAERHLDIFERSPEIGLTFSWSAYLDEEGETTGQYLTSRCHSPVAKDLTRRNHVGNGSTSIVRRACFQQAGLFDEGMRSCEDLDMWIRIAAETSFTLRLIPELLTGYRVRQGSLSVSFDGFIRAAEKLKHHILVRAQGLEEDDARRCLAQLLRIASRKALANGQVRLSRTLLYRAAREHSGSVLADPRGMALSLIHLVTAWLPESVACGFYGFTARATGQLTTRVLSQKRRRAGVVTV
jgi:GT2 family glycosyltransferase